MTTIYDGTKMHDPNRIYFKATVMLENGHMITYTDSRPMTDEEIKERDKARKKEERKRKLEKKRILLECEMLGDNVEELNYTNMKDIVDAFNEFKENCEWI